MRKAKPETYIKRYCIVDIGYRIYKQTEELVYNRYLKQFIPDTAQECAFKFSDDSVMRVIVSAAGMRILVSADNTMATMFFLEYILNSPRKQIWRDSKEMVRRFALIQKEEWGVSFKKTKPAAVFHPLKANI